RTLVRGEVRREVVREAGIEVGVTGSCEPNLELAGIEVHLLGDHDRLHGADALAEVDVLRNERYFLRTDLDPRIEGHGVRPEASGQRIAIGGRSSLFGIAVGTESDAAGDGGGAEHESATRNAL